MKAQFKYAFLAGLNVRGQVFAVIFIMNTVFITMGSLGLLPLAAHITAVSLGGVAIAVMLAADIGGDVFIARRMFSAPEAYLHALSPVPRRKILLASVITMAVLDIVSMAVVITQEVWLSFNLAGDSIKQLVWDFIHSESSYLIYALWCVLFLISAYLLLMMIIMFCVTMKKSVFFKMPVPGLLAFLLACGCFYVISLLQLVLVPFGDVQRYWLLIIITLNSGAAVPLLILLTLLEAAALFILTSKLMERKINL